MSNAVRFTQKIAIQTFQVYALLLIALSSAALAGCSGLVSSSNTAPPSTLAITNVQTASVTTSSSQVVWTTNVAADSSVDYGTTTSYGNSTPVDSTMVTSHQMTLSGLAAGTTYYYQVNSTDSKGNHGHGGNKFNTTGFSLSGAITPTAAGNGATVALNGATSASATADSSGNYAFAGLANGTYTIAPSHAGFTFTPGSKSMAVNGANVTGVNFTATATTVAPSITSLNPTSGVLGTPVTITGANFGATQGTSSVTFNGIGATPTSWSATSIAVPVPAGATTGNVVVTVGGAASNGVSFTVPVPAPSISSMNPTSGVVGTSVTISGANFGATQGSSTVKFNGTTATASIWSATSIVAPVPAGATTGNVVVTVGGAASNGLSFTVSVPAPTVSITSPANGATVSGTITLSAAASSSVGVASVQFQLDGTNLGALATVAPYSISWNTTTASNGSHTLKAIAKDTAGNSATSAGVTVTVSNSSTPPPTVSITSPANGATVSGTITVSATASSSLGVANVQFLVDGGNFGAPDTTTPYTISLDTTTLSNGNHTLAATAQDTAGKTTTSAGVTVSVSNAPPPPPPPGSTVTSFKLQSPLSGTFPFTVGLGFKKGDVPSAVSLNLPNQQVVVKSSWNDGSVKHAIASGRAAFTANTPLTVNVLPQAGSSGTATTCSNIQTAAPTASVQLGSIGTVSLASLLASPFRTWVSGSEMVECHYRSAVGSDPTLVVWYHVRLYADGRMWVRAVVENGYLDVTTSDKSYVPTVIIGGTTVYNNGGASLTNYAQTRWTVEGWIGGDPGITPQHDARYLEAAKLVPNYMNRTPSSSALNALYQTYTPMTTSSGWTQNMSDPGFQYQIGLLPRWDALWVTSNADSHAYQSVLANAKALNSYQIVWNDSATSLPTLPANRPTWSYCGPGCGGGNTFFGGPLGWDVAHHGSGGYLAYLLTGDYFYLDTMEDQAASCYLIQNSGNGSGNNRALGSQTRGVAWCLRTIGQLVGIGPASDTQVSGYQAWLAGLATILSNTAQQPGMNPLGYVYSYELATNAYGTGVGTLAPWQEHFFTQSVAMVSDLEPFSNMTTWLALRTYLDLAPVGIAGPSNTVGAFSFTQAGSYNLQVAPLPSTPIGQWGPNWGAVWTTNYGAVAPDNTLHGTSGSDPLNACIGIWGNFMPALAYAVDHGSAGASAAWTRFTGASNYSSINNCTATVPADAGNWNDTPIWGIVPRAVISTPPPPTTSVSVTAPTTGATVSGTVSVIASASSSAGVAGVQFQLDSANLGAQVTTAPYSTSWNTTTTTDGTHFLGAVARDSQGNLTASSSVSVTVSNTPGGTPPTISAVASTPSTSGALVIWATDQPATSQVEYGPTTAYGGQSSLDSSLVTSHSVTLSGLSSSTIYQFRVHSTNAGGNAAVSGNFNFTTLVQSGGGIPSALGWYQIPNTTLAPNCPNDSSIQGSSGCAAVISAWGGGTADTKRSRLLIWGGGHSDYYGNEVYALDLNALTMSRIINPTSNPTLCVPEQPDGHPSSRHTYYDLAYMATADKMFSFGGAPACQTGIGSSDTWTLDLPTLGWHRQDPTTGGTNPSGAPGLAVVAYDPNTNLVFVEDLSNLYSFNLSTNTYTMLGPVNGVDYHQSGVIDPTRKLLFLVGGGQLWAINIAAGSNYALQDWSSQVSGCGSLLSSGYPGLAFDTKQSLVVGWTGGNSVLQFNPSTKACTTVTYSGGPGQSQGNGTNGRFAYFPSLNLFAVVNDWQENAYSLRLTQ